MANFHFRKNDLVRVHYDYRDRAKYYVGRVIESVNHGNITDVTVQPLDKKYVLTFNDPVSAKLGFMTYPANHRTLGMITPHEVFSPFETINS